MELALDACGRAAPDTGAGLHRFVQSKGFMVAPDTFLGDTVAVTTPCRRQSVMTLLQAWMSPFEKRLGMDVGETHRGVERAG